MWCAAAVLHIARVAGLVTVVCVRVMSCLQSDSAAVDDHDEVRQSVRGCAGRSRVL
jgi:hypothetical protein